METFRLGNLTKAMNATQRPIPMKSMRAQCPVSTQTQTTQMEIATERISASVNLPHTPSDILPLVEQGLTRYWHMGSSRNASATVAITAVQTANNN